MRIQYRFEIRVQGRHLPATFLNRNCGHKLYVDRHEIWYQHLEPQRQVLAAMIGKPSWCLCALLKDLLDTAVKPVPSDEVLLKPGPAGYLAFLAAD